MSKPNWKVDRFTGYYGNALIKVLHGEDVKNWDNLKKQVTRIHVNSSELNIDLDEEIEKKEREEKELEEAKTDKAVNDLRHEWKQQLLFEVEE